MGRLGIWAALAACWVAACVLGIGGVALRTEAGRDLVARTVVGVVNDRIDGTLSIGDLDGSFFEGLEAHDVVLAGSDGSVVLELARLQLRYRLADLLSGRIVLGQLILERPRVALTKSRPDQPFNLELLFPSDSGAKSRSGPSLLVAFRDVEIRDGTLIIRTSADSTDGGVIEGESSPEGYLRVQRIGDLWATLDYLRLVSPRADERGILAEIASLRAAVTDPRVTVEQLRGQARLVGDSLKVDLAELRLEETDAQVRGSLAWDQGPLLFDLDVRARRVMTDEVRWLVAELPSGVAGKAEFRVRAYANGRVEVTGENVELEGLGGGGRLEGRLGISVGPGDSWGARNTDLKLRDFDLEYVRGFLDTLPIAGRVTGSVKADGSRERLAVELDVLLRDSLVPGWPQSEIRGKGFLRLGSGDLTLEAFAVEETDLDLATLRRLVPAIALQGRLRASGTLNGPWLELSYDGLLRHRDAPAPESAIRGPLRMDARGETVGVWGDVQLDSLRLAGLRQSYPGIPVDGTFAGRVVLAGYLDSLVMQARLTGPAGTLSAGGAVILAGGALGLHDMDLEADRVNLRRLRADLPQTTLSGKATVSGIAREGMAPEWSLELALARSRIEGVPVDSAQGRVLLADTLVQVDTLRVWAEGIRAVGRGAFGVAAPRAGLLTVQLRADSIGVLEPLLAKVLGEPDSVFAGVPPSGSLQISAELRGSLEAYDLSATFEARDLQRADVLVTRAEGVAAWSAPFRDAQIEAEIDSLRFGNLAFTAVESRVTGQSDSLSWFGRARFGTIGSWIAGGQLLIDSTTYVVPVDSMAFLLATGAWFVDTTAVVVVSDSGVDFRHVRFANAAGASRLSLEGRLPFRGPADLRGSFEAVSLRDLSLLLQKFAGQVDGELGGTFTLGGTARAPTIEATGALREGLFQTVRVPYLDGRVLYRDKRLDGDFALWRLGERFVQVDMRLPIDLALTTVETRQLPGDLMVRAVADSAPLSFLEAILPVVRRAGGMFAADVGITGSWADPQLAGRVTIKDGAASFPPIGVRHERLNGTLVLSGETIRIERLTLKSGRGTAEVTGSVRLEDLTHPILDIRINGRDFHAVNIRNFLSLTATADLQLTGPPLGARLTGAGTATSGTLYFADLIAKQVINLEDTFFAEFVYAVDSALIREQRLGAAWQQRFLDSLQVEDLRVRMGNDVWMRSSEANIQLAGELTVNKARNAYRLTGTLEAPRGTYRLPLGPVTREFTVTQGELRYFGTPDLNADVDIDAQHIVRTVRGEDVTVFVNIGGTLYDPRLTLRSDLRRATSETEIISYLLFGAPSVQALAVESRAANQGLQNQAVGQLAGVLSGQLEYALISDLGVPLDYVQIRPGDIGAGLSGTEIAIGKQFNLLGTTAFLTASPRICPQTFSAEDVGASLEFRLTRHWLFAASADPLRACGSQSSRDVAYQFGLELFWEKSY